MNMVLACRMCTKHVGSAVAGAMKPRQTPTKPVKAAQRLPPENLTSGTGITVSLAGVL